MLMDCGSKELAMHLHNTNSVHNTHYISYHFYSVGSLVMEHPGTHPLPIQGKPTIFGGVNGSIGMITVCQEIYIMEQGFT